MKPPSPPRGLTPAEARLWRDLSHAVHVLGTYQPTDLVAFRALVRAVARAEAAPLDSPPSAAARLETAAGAALAGFGLTPASRQRVRPTKDPRTPGQRVLEAIANGRT